MRYPVRALLVLLLGGMAIPAAAEDTLQQRVEAALAKAGPGTRFGLLIVADDGREIVAVNPDQRFIPASNTKMFTTAAAFATLDVDAPDMVGGAAVRIEGPDIILEGHGDARLSSAADCMVDCLATLADAVAAKVRTVRDVVGDDSAWPDQRWSPGMSWNNIPRGSGTAISALTIDDNEVAVVVTPGPIGRPPTATLLPYYKLDNRATTVAAGETSVDYDRLPFDAVVRVAGAIAVDAQPETLRFGIDDPAHYAAWRLKTLLEARGVRVTGAVTVRHRALVAGDDPAVRGAAPPPRPPAPPPLARLVPPSLSDDLTRINKVSQNLHAELMLRRIGYRAGTASIADGVAAVRSMLDQAGVARTSYDFSDGSGMSTYNRVSPRGVVTFLRWIAAQSWGAKWRATLPIGGVDGTLTKAFKGTALEGKLFAKTGTLNATNALSGYLIARSGRTLTFSLYANDVPDGASATEAMYAALLIVANQVKPFVVSRTIEYHSGIVGTALASR